MDIYFCGTHTNIIYNNILYILKAFAGGEAVRHFFLLCFFFFLSVFTPQRFTRSEFIKRVSVSYASARNGSVDTGGDAAPERLPPLKRYIIRDGNDGDEKKSEFKMSGSVDKAAQ